MCSEHTISGDSREYQIAVITWVDIEDRSSPGWIPWDQAISDAREPFQPILTVGIVLWEDDKKLALTASAGPEETSGALSIPKSVIISDVRHSVGVEIAVPPAGAMNETPLRGHDGEEKMSDASEG